MDNVISFTPAELVAFITAIGGAIVTVGAVITLIAKLITKARLPELKQNERLDAIEATLETHQATLDKYEVYFANDDSRFKAIENSNRITLEALLALLKHAQDGNNVKALVDAENNLKKYLIEK